MNAKLLNGLALFSSITLLTAFLLFRGGIFDNYLGKAKSFGKKYIPGKTDTSNQVEIYPSSIPQKQQPVTLQLSSTEILPSSKSTSAVVTLTDLATPNLYFFQSQTPAIAIDDATRLSGDSNSRPLPSYKLVTLPNISRSEYSVRKSLLDSLRKGMHPSKQPVAREEYFFSGSKSGPIFRTADIDKSVVDSIIKHMHIYNPGSEQKKQ